MLRSVVVIILVSLIVPCVPMGSETGLSLSPVAETEAATPELSEVTFDEPIDTSDEVPEYPQVSRALMLSGGSSDAALADMDDDGQADLIMAVYEEKTISIFYRQADGSFLSYPSYNITTLNNPFRIEPIDVYSDGGHQIVSLERNPTTSGTYLVVYNLTSPTSHETWPDKPTYSRAIDFTTGLFSSSISPLDNHPDLALVCAGPTLGSERLYVYFGPDFKSWGYEEIIQLGVGANAVESADVDGDSLDEVLVSHSSNNSEVIIFKQPLNFGSFPARILDVEGSPTDLVAGLFDGDSYYDLAVTTELPSAIRIFSNSLGLLPTEESYNSTLEFAPSQVVSGDVNGDGDTDLLLLSQKHNLTAGFYQRSTSSICQDPLDFKLPVGGLPRAAVIGDMNGDSMPDIAVASARLDWSGSSVALYPMRSPTFSNANATAWIDGGLTPKALASGDLNGDDVVDLVVVSEDSTLLECYLGFSGAPISVDLGIIPDEVLMHDFDQDGYADMVVSSSGSSILKLVSGAAAPTYPTTDLYCGGGVMDVEIGDLNNDYWIDVLVATDDGRVDIFFNSMGPEPFSIRHEFSPTPGAGIWSVAVGDFNSDGLEDIAYTRSIRKVTILYQSLYYEFGLMSASTNLSHTVGSDFTVIWSGDVTGDGKDDIIAMRPSDPALYLFDQEMFISAPHPYATLTLPEVPEFVSVLDATDDGPADVVAIFDTADLLFLYRFNGTSLPDIPSMTFVTGAHPVHATIGDGSGDHRGDLLTLDAGSRTVSIWQQNNFPPLAHSGGPYFTMEGFPMRFAGSATTGTSEIPYMEYNWSFGDGNVSGWVRQPRPVHTYMTMGNYSVSVDVRDPAGLSSSDSTYVIVEDSRPIVRFSWSPTSVREGQVVTFTDLTSSFDPIASSDWYVDGVSFGSGSNISVDFQNGTHSIVLAVTDTDGSSEMHEELIVVESSAPEIRIVAPLAASEGAAVAFEVLVDEWHGTPVDPIVLYEWDFSYVSGSFFADPYTPNSAAVTHVFSAWFSQEVFRVAVRVNDSDGQSNITTWDILIFDTHPTAGFVLSDPTPEEGAPFSFISTSLSVDGIANWTWTLTYPDESMKRYYDNGTTMAVRQFSDLDDGDYVMNLTVRESDGNTSWYSTGFHVLEIDPVVALDAEEGQFPVDYEYEEFTPVEFSVTIDSIDPIVQYQWDFDYEVGDFTVDLITTNGSAEHAFYAVGVYAVQVRAFDSDGSYSTDTLLIEVLNRMMYSDFERVIRVTRNYDDTNIVDFNITELLLWYPDLVEIRYDFGDGTVVDDALPLSMSVIHTFVPGRDYTIYANITDDDGRAHSMSFLMAMDPPTVVLLDPYPNAVIQAGLPLMFLIEPGSSEVVSAGYNVNGQEFPYFPSMFSIDTYNWPEARYRVFISATDAAGNRVVSDLWFTVDNTAPKAFLSSSDDAAFIGDRLNVTIKVDDPHMNASGVILYAKFPGDAVFMPYNVVEAYPGVYYRIIEVPEEEGMVEFYANVTDLAGNFSPTPYYYLDVRYHLIDIAWPYLLLAAVLAALGTGGYFVREAKMAVDETFVIYNDGRLISHSTRRLKPGMDDQVLGSMFVAIQDFVKDSFKDITSFTLRRLDFGEKSIVIEKGNYLYLAVVLHGQPSKKVAMKMQTVVKEIEEEFGEHLEGWDGDFDKVRGVNDLVKKLYSRMPMMPSSRKTT